MVDETILHWLIFLAVALLAWILKRQVQRISQTATRILQFAKGHSRTGEK
jgi:cytochrome b561